MTARPIPGRWYSDNQARRTSPPKEWVTKWSWSPDCTPQVLRLCCTPATIVSMASARRA
ncbi:MAG: hypothetical protein ABIJ65_14370 [Chloroflexota bacterium]